MTELHLREFGSTDALRSAAGAWDDLWFRSDVHAPTVRALCVAHWVAQFAPAATFRALSVEGGDGRLLAALPLVGCRMKRIVRVGMLPANDWTASGDLLLDPACDTAAVLDLLVAGLRRLPWKLLLLRGIDGESARWMAFREALRRAGLSDHFKPVTQIPQVEIGDDWDRYLQSLKGDHRRSRLRYARKLDEAGGATLRVETPGPDEVEELLRRGFEVEDRSWKGAAGTSVLRTAGMFDHYLAEARQIAHWGQLELVFLEHRGRPIAFDYGWRSRGTHFTPKLGYDDAFRRFGPGQTLLMHLLERLHADADCKLLDFWGPLADWHNGWATRTYQTGRLAVVVSAGISPVLFRTFVRWQPRVARIRERVTADTSS